MVDHPEPDIEDAEHSIAGEEQDADGIEENGGSSDENGPRADPEAKLGTDLVLAQGDEPHEVVNPFPGPTPEQRNCMHLRAWYRWSGASLCQVCQWYAYLHFQML